MARRAQPARPIDPVRNVPDAGVDTVLEGVLDVVAIAPDASASPTSSGIVLPRLERAERKRSPARAFLARHAHVPGTHDTFEKALRAIVQLTAPALTLDSYPWHELQPDHCAWVRTKLAEHYRSPATANLRLSALRGVLGVAWSDGLLESDTYQRDLKELPPRKGHRVTKGRRLREEELRALSSACDASTVAGARDAALLALLYGAGLRRCEAARVPLAAFKSEPPTLRVVGKGNREDDVALPPWAGRALARWIELRGNDDGPIIHRVSRVGNVKTPGMTTQGVWLAVARIGARAGIDHFAPHDFRRTVITTLLERGVPITTVQRFARHAQVSTTAVYDRQDARAQRRAVQLVSDPAEQD